jgi:Acetyltransferase (GNAT) domain
MDNNYDLLVGINMIAPLSGLFDQVFSSIEAPLTGRFPGLKIWMENHLDVEPWGILVKRDGNVVAAAILTRYRRHGFWRIGKPGGKCDPVHFGAIDADAASRLAQAICDAVQNFGGPWIMEISDLPYPDPVVIQIQAICKSSLSIQDHQVACLIFKPDTTLNSYLSSNTRSAIAKASNRIKRDNIQMVKQWTRDKSQIQSLLPQLIAVYRSRDYQKYGHCLLDNPNSENFFEQFVTEHANLGLIDLLTIHFGKELAAFGVCLLENGLCKVLVNRASPDWLQYSPGTIANAEIVKHAFEDPNSFGVNWDGPLSRYKLSGDVTLLHRQTLYAWSSDIVRRLQNIRQYLRRPLINKTTEKKAMNYVD